MNVKIAHIAFSILILAAPALVRAEATFGQASDVMNIGAGARSMAMGSAFTGLADDASAPYFNPAGLAFLDEHQLMLMHAPLFLDTDYNYVASAHPFGDRWGTLALSDAMLLSDKFELRDINNAKTGSDGSLTNNSIYASYARKLHQKVGVGANVKLLQQKIAGMSDSAFGLDAGILVHPLSFLSVGASFSNINSPSVTLQSSKDVYRPISRFGVAADVFRNKLMLTVDLVKISQQKALYATGAEFRPNRLLSLRTGFNANRSYTLGMGVNLHPIRIDYAFSDTDLGAFNKVSITWAWHNIYKTEVEPPMKEGRAVYPLGGFENEVKFRADVPQHVVARWNLIIKDEAGNHVRTLEGDLRPPETIVWDARNQVGEPTTAGVYTYRFDVAYKNGKRWMNEGRINLALPNRKTDEVIDMNLQLNGARESDIEESAVTAIPTSEMTAPAQPMIPQALPETPAETEAPKEN